MARKQERHPVRGGAVQQNQANDTGKQMPTPSDKTQLLFHTGPAPWQADDAAWFRKHPKRCFRLRTITFAEFPRGLAAAFTHVIVCQITPGYRQRRPVNVTGHPPTGLDPDFALMLCWQQMIDETEDIKLSSEDAAMIAKLMPLQGTR